MIPRRCLMKVLEVSSHSGISLKNILFATDFSEASEAAVSYAAAICHQYGSQLHVIHTVSPASYIVPTAPDGPVTMESMYDLACADARQRMQTLSSHLKVVPHHTYVREGELWDGIAEMIRTHAIALVIVGTRG